MSKAFKFELEFIKKKKLTTEVYSFYFKWPKKSFNFIPGQYLKIFLNIEDVDERGSSRYFTISSSPEEKEYLTITTKIIKSKFKKKLIKLRSREKVLAFGPIGYFNYDSRSKLDNVFISTGIGITPFKSILNTIDLLGNKNKSYIYLFAFFSKRDEILFYDELEGIQKKNNKLKIIYCLTNEVDDNFEHSRFNLKLLNKHLENFRSMNYFVIGSKKSVNSINNSLIKFGVEEKNIFKEDFPGY